MTRLNLCEFRSATPAGVATALADQWGGFVEGVRG
jgi:hypothetical protein